VAEVTARTTRLWIYRKALYPVVNILAAFGLAMGSLATRVTEWGPVTVTAVAFLVGYGYEFANFRWLDWWYFPGNRFLFLHGQQACAVSVACLWGLVPMAAHTVTALMA
jgi:hypothetical protein